MALVAAVMAYLWAASGQARLRAKLKARGFKLSTAELIAARTGPSRDLHELVEATLELKKVNFPQFPGEFHLMNFGSSNVLVSFTKSEKPFWAAADTNLCSKTWKELAEAVRKAAPPLQRVRAAASQMIPETGLGEKTPVFDFIHVAFWLAADAMSAARQASREEALADLEALNDLALIGSNEKCHITQIGRAAVISISVKTTWELLQSEGWTDEELRRMEISWMKVLPLGVVTAAAEGDLAGVDEGVKDVQKELLQAPLQERLVTMAGLMDKGADTEFLFEWHLANWEAARALLDGRPWPALRPDLTRLKLEALSRRKSRYRHLVLRRLMTPIDSTFATCAGCEAARQLLLTDIANKRFQLHHDGSLPKTIQQLRPAFLDPASGRDIFGVGDLKYRPGVGGAYLLYSVGRDGVDDAGSLSVLDRASPFWEWRDIVWCGSR